MDDIKFCCEDIKRFSSGNASPLSQDMCNEGSPFIGFHIEYCVIKYCPCCGMYLGKKPEPSRRRLNDQGFCCSLMAANVNVSDELWIEIFYQSFVRRYFFAEATNSRTYEPLSTIFQEWDLKFCIYCGRKLPEPLLDLWLEIVKEEFGVGRMAPLEKMLPLVPEEFQTDWWWKKRGL